jgi:hypothetical protein
LHSDLLGVGPNLDEDGLACSGGIDRRLDRDVAGAVVLASRVGVIDVQDRWGRLRQGGLHEQRSESTHLGAQEGAEHDPRHDPEPPQADKTASGGAPTVQMLWPAAAGWPWSLRLSSVRFLSCSPLFRLQ